MTQARRTARHGLILQQPEAEHDPKQGRVAKHDLRPSEQAIPIWGGVECTLNRIGDIYLDQAEFSGHARRLEDFQHIAATGIRTLRFGMIWERHDRTGSWDWTDRCMQEMRLLGTRPIVGLMHHGSGPPHTSLLDPEMPQLLANYAGEVAARYPDVEAYTPVNEPNTTARFSGQYGLWYPHGHSSGTYLRALLNQVKATVLSMAAIRRVRPDAQLIQTDDCGSITSTPDLKSVAHLLHTRQWLTFDLLFGRVDRFHPMFQYMRSRGIGADEILWFEDNPCPPNVIGLNYYPTSDRFLDERRHLYPAHMGSSEGPFVDVEAVRVEGCTAADFLRPITEAWQRYGRPIALTEVHLGGAVEEQIRWLAAAYLAMQRAQQNGVQCEGLTVWALLGSFFWNELVTRDNGYYEAGAFDVRSGKPVPTELANFMTHLAAGTLPSQHLGDQPGWWAREDRTCYPWAEAPNSQAA